MGRVANARESSHSMRTQNRSNFLFQRKTLIRGNRTTNQNTGPRMAEQEETRNRRKKIKISWPQKADAFLIYPWHAMALTRSFHIVWQRRRCRYVCGTRWPMAIVFPNKCKLFWFCFVNVFENSGHECALPRAKRPLQTFQPPRKWKRKYQTKLFNYYEFRYDNAVASAVDFDFLL